MNINYFRLLLAFGFLINIGNAEKTNIGLVVESTNADLEKIFHKAIEIANGNDDSLQLTGVTANITYGNTFEMSKKLCKLLKSSVVAVFGPTASIPAAHAMSICDAKEMPFMDTRWDFTTQLPTINLHPHPNQLAAVLKDLVIAFGWSDFTILYEAGEHLSIVNDLLQMYTPSGPTVTVRRYELELNGNYRNVLRRVKKSSDRCFVVVGTIETLPELLKQAQQVGLMTDGYSYIIGNLDLQTIDLEPYQHGDANITGIRLISPEDERVMEILKGLVEEDENPLKNVSCPMTVNMALVYDGVQLLSETFKHVMYRPVPLNCADDSTWDKGYTLVNYMKSLSINGLSGDIKFDYRGLRTDFELEIVELTTTGVTKVGAWTPSGGYQVNRKAIASAGPDFRSLANQSFIVLTALSDPYGMLKETSIKLEGNEQYEGFGVELIQELGKMLGFNYTFQLQVDGVYGSLNSETGQWNGMMREIMDGRADLGITDLTMTSDRESAVDFTIPFMNLGIAILYKKPTKEPPKLFSFMSPFDGDVWLWLGLGYFGVSLSLFILGRLSPVEWDNPYPCIEEPTELENQFSFANSLWFTVGALLQQGSEIAPKAASTRAVAAIWWFFTLILVSSYTANLAAFLTIESLSTPIENAEDLAAGKGNVQYGAKRGGATYNFFKDSKYPTYQKMYEYMKDHQEFMTSTNAEGVNRVENENYAFLMESTTIEYIIERKCSLTQVGSLLDEKGYGIAMRKNWPYRDALSQALLELQEQGVLTKMKTKWWKEKRGGGACSDTGGDGGALALEIANLGGVFLVLIVGSFFAIFVAFLEMVLDVKQRSFDNKQNSDQDSAEELGFANLGGVFFVLFVGSAIASCLGVLEWLYCIIKTAQHNKVSFRAELLDELKFIMQCSGNTKMVKYPKTSGSSSSSRSSSNTIDSVGTDNLDDSKTHTPNEDIKLQK